jgi:cystathionine beta-lyase/cystathionine gamma-synthase
MSDQTHAHGVVRPRTAVLTRGFDPTLSVGSARPAVFRSSTYVFPSPEEAEHAFAITTGKIQMEDGGRADPSPEPLDRKGLTAHFCAGK